MKTVETGEPERLEADYIKRKAKLRANPALSYEKKELAVRRLGLEYDEARRKLEEGE
jgi:hypothetical protein